MNIEDAVTNPLPRAIREPLLLLLDAREARRVWVVRILGLANYHVYAPDTAQEAAIWFFQHAFAPQAILIGELHPYEQSLTQLLFRRYVVQGSRQIPVVSLADAASEFASTDDTPYVPDLRQGMDLLDLLWQEVSRRF